MGYTTVKTDELNAFRDAARELMDIATVQEPRPPELDTMAEVFAVAGEKQETVADEATIALLKRFAAYTDVEKARAEFDRAQKVEKQFHRDFDGLDFTGKSLPPHDKSENTSFKKETFPYFQREERI